MKVTVREVKCSTFMGLSENNKPKYKFYIHYTVAVNGKRVDSFLKKSKANALAKRIKNGSD